MKSVIVTGVGKGFGKEIFFELLKKFHVIGITRSNEDVEKLEGQLKGVNNYTLICADVNSFDTLHSLIRKTLSVTPPLWGLINNAGMRFRKNFLDTEMSEIEQVLQTNLLSVMHLSKIVLPYMLKNDGGRIINVSSILSQSALPQLSIYAVSKGGLDAFTRSLAVEFGDQNIRTNSLLPGFCETSYFPKFKEQTDLYQMTIDRTPAKCWGGPSELNHICQLLLGDGGNYINGASISIDGGWLA